MLQTRTVQTEQAQAAMAERNARRIDIVKRKLGTKYAHHPANHVQRADAQRAKLRPYQLELVERIKREGIAPGGIVIELASPLDFTNESTRRFARFAL